MSKTQPSEELQYFEALKSYADAYVLKRKKSRQEGLLQDTKKLYVIYARKSTEDDKRQVQSIENQIEECLKFAKYNQLDVVPEAIREEKSAKNANKRPKFDEMLTTIKGGEYYNCILAWHPDRLARNMKEAGEILDMLDKGTILDLKFPSYSFNNDAAGKMTLSILFAMAKEFSDKLSDDTIRGNEKKIRDGKYCGTAKRGYTPDKNDYFVPNASFKLYKEAWQMYLTGKSQTKISEWLKANNEQVDSKTLSYTFQDPFYAGIYCYGNLRIDLKKIDPSFKPMVSPKDFIAVQRENRATPRGFHRTSDFRPFNSLVYCYECKHPMISGLSTGQKNKYLNITCTTKTCRESRQGRNIVPISNTIRGDIIINFATDLIEKGLNITEKIYRKAKEVYFNESNKSIELNKLEIKSFKGENAKLHKRAIQISNKALEIKGTELSKDLAEEYKSTHKKIKDNIKEIKKLEEENAEKALNLDLDFPSYTDFVNTFKDIVTTLKTSEDIYLMDKLVKLVFVNITVWDKKVLSYKLNEPFETFGNLNFITGVTLLMKFGSILSYPQYR